MTVGYQIPEHILMPELKKKRRLKDHFDPDLTHILVDRSFIMDTHIPGLSGRCFIIGSVHKNTGFWKMHRSAYRVQLPGQIRLCKILCI